MSNDEVGTWPALEELAHRFGVSTDYWDWQGNRVPVSIATVQAVLRAFGIDASSPAVVATELRRVDEAPWRRMLPPVSTVRAGSGGSVLAHVRHGDPLTVEIHQEGGGTVALSQEEHNVPPREIDGGLVGEARFALPADLPLGYHSLVARSGDRSERALLVVSPTRLETPAGLARQQWGLQTQLYSVRSRDSWGLGDFHDLGQLAAWAAGHGAAFVLVNPLHAPEPVPPIQNSPYLPTSRRFVSPLYIRVEDIPEVTGLAATPAAIVDKYAVAARAGQEHAELLDRQASWRTKLGALDAVFSAGMSPARATDFGRFREDEGPELERFALWCAMFEHFGPESQWPDWALDPESPEVADLGRHLERRVTFFAWLQWIADAQLGAAHARARAAGMTIGIMTDLAVGVHPSGADSWSLGSAMARGVNVGAPPDAFNQVGQDWSQPPWRPDRLAELGYAPYRAMLQAVLRHAGGLRIDHVMGLFRLWCIPQGHPPRDGAYLRYDFEAMVSILLLEAHRAGAFVVGEDLGVVEPFVREYLAERGVLGTSILWFEADGGVPRPPESYRELCLATVTTHDLPPTAGYLAGDHVRLRDELGLLTRPLLEELEVAVHEREAVLAVLRKRGLIGPDADEQEVVEGLHLLLRRAPSILLGVALTDLVGDRRTQNQPGTDQEYPNWCIPLAGPDGQPIWLEDLDGNARAARLSALMTDPIPEGAHPGSR